MDTEIREAIDKLRDDIAKMKEDFRCPQPGCRYMESKCGKADKIANWLTSLGIIVMIGLQIYGGSQ